MSGTQELASVFKELAEDQELTILSVDENIDEDDRVEFRAEDSTGEVFHIIIMKEELDVFTGMRR